MCTIVRCICRGRGNFTVVLVVIIIMIIVIVIVIVIVILVILSLSLADRLHPLDVSNSPGTSDSEPAPLTTSLIYCIN